MSNEYDNDKPVPQFFVSHNIVSHSFAHSPSKFAGAERMLTKNMGYLTSGNYTVDSMGSIHISGNVVPMIWYRTITRPNGKPHLLAITILSDIVYWYRPSEVRDERSGQVVGWQKRFKGEFLQKTYQQYADLFGESKRSVKAAFDVLENLGVIKRLFDDVTCENGLVFYNLMYVELDTDILYALTYPEWLSEETEPEEVIDDMEKCTPYPQNDVGGGTKFCTTPLQNNVVPPTKDCNYTKNTTETTTDNINPIYRSESDADTLDPQKAEGVDVIDREDIMNMVNKYRQIIEENIDYDCLKTDFGNRKQAELLEEIVELIVETISLEKDSVRVGGDNIPFQMVKSRLLKLNNMHVRYVIDCMQKGTSRIKNIRAYLLTALYNAPGTIGHYYQAKVNHDMFEAQGWYGDG